MLRDRNWGGTMKPAPCFRAALLCTILGVGAAHAGGNAPGQPANGSVDLSSSDLEGASLEDLLDTVVTSGRISQRVSEAPSVITVIRAEEIETRGYTSLADVLRTVPGFYDVYDMAFHNVGIRGISPGARASGSQVKVMIDGQEVDYRPSTGNFFGEELVPMSAVERIEIFRGPGSALYGADAFLGVINVITRSGLTLNGLKATARAGSVAGHAAGGGEAVVGGTEGKLDVLVAGSGWNMNRGGLTLPGSSPALDRSSFGSGSLVSDTDLARPKSGLARLAFGDAKSGRLTLWGSVQHLEAGGQFQDYGILNSGSRISRLNQHYRASFDREFGSTASVKVSGTYFSSATLDREQVDVGYGDRVLRPDVGSTGYELQAETTLRPFSWMTVTLAGDYRRETHALQDYDTVYVKDVFRSDGSMFASAGTVVPGVNGSKTVDFTNGGGLAHVLMQAGDSLGITVGARLDSHSVYGVQFSPRVGIVYSRPRLPYYVKLLFGSSFKAPSAEQLYTAPLGRFDVVGNAQLAPQTAQTYELAGGYRLGNKGEIVANAFITRVHGRVDYVQDGIYFRAVNGAPETLAGGEAELRMRVVPPLELRAGVGIATTVSKRQQGDPSTGGLVVQQPVFPPMQVHLLADYTLADWGLHFAPEVSWISPRSASQTNALERYTDYTLPGYLYTAVAVTWRRQLWSGGATAVQLRCNNLLDRHYVDPGYNGVDLPALGRTLFLGISQTF